MRNSFLKGVISALSIIFGFMSMTAKTSYIFLAPGVEEVEATATVDALRRASMDVVTVAVGDNLQVKGATGQTLVADSIISEVNTDDADWLIIPGGDPGAQNLAADSSVRDMIMEHFNKNGRIASICAGPAVVLAPLGVLKGKKATCYPGLGDAINSNGGEYVKQTVVVEPELITSEGPGTTLPFAIEIIRATKGNQAAESVASGMLVNEN
jgi:4-methyl-5(b-hydroxyethyl)-thiazole monophosphate biosynthesis